VNAAHLSGWLLALQLVAACGPAHIAPFKERERKYDIGDYAAAKKQNKPSNGSVYSDARGNFLEDTRALRIGDVVMIRIKEEADAKGNAGTNLSKTTSREAGVIKLAGLIPALQKAYPDLTPEELLDLSSASGFEGEGKTERTGSLNGRIGVRVKQELPNGDLYVEGTKVVMINHEEYHLYVSGVLRPADIDPDNSVDSNLIADARVEFTGRGDINDQVERGWLTEFLDFINPF
jgi:flagellar L-ring protein precursor FlgH